MSALSKEFFEFDEGAMFLDMLLQEDSETATSMMEVFLTAQPTEDAAFAAALILDALINATDLDLAPEQWQFAQWRDGFDTSKLHHLRAPAVEALETHLPLSAPNGHTELRAIQQRLRA